jgi:hypothetical protein
VVSSPLQSPKLTKFSRIGPTNRSLGRHPDLAHRVDLSDRAQQCQKFEVYRKRTVVEFIGWRDSVVTMSTQLKVSDECLRNYAPAK